MVEAPVSKDDLELKKENLKTTHTVDKQSVLSEVRKGHGGKEVLKHADVPPKSGQNLMSEVRAESKNVDKLKKASTIEKQSLLSEVRADHGGGHLKETPVLKAEVLAEALSDREGDDPVKIVPAVAEQSIQYGQKHLKEAKTVDKQSVLSAVRKEHGGAEVLKHTGVAPKSGQALLSEVRNTHAHPENLHWAPTVDKKAVMSEVRKEHGGKEVLKHTSVPPKSGQGLMSQVRSEGKHPALKKAPTVAKQSLLSEVRADHGGSHLKDTPVLKAEVLAEALSDRAGDDPVKIVPAVAEQSIQYGQKHLKEAKTVDKQSVLSEVRKEQGGKNALKHTGVKPKSARDLMTEVRAEGKHPELNKAPTVEKQSLLSELRADHGGSHLKEARVVKKEVVEEALSDRAGDDPVKIVPVVAEQSIQYGKKNLKEAHVTNTSVLKEALSDRGGDDSVKIVPAVAEQSIKFGKKHLKESAAPVEKHTLLSEVRAEAKHPLLKKASKVEKQSLLSEVRSEAKHPELKKAETVEKQSLLSEVRAEAKHTDLKKAETTEKKSLLSEVRAVHGGVKETTK